VGDRFHAQGRCAEGHQGRALICIAIPSAKPTFGKPTVVNENEFNVPDKPIVPFESVSESELSTAPVTVLPVTLKLD
jgi:hypothetical protein